MKLSKLRLLYVLDNYWPHVGGAERAFKAVCEGMVRRGHEVTVLTSHVAGSAREEYVEGVRIVREGATGNRYAFTAQAVFPAIALARRADVIHAGTFNSAPVASIAGRFARKPAALTVFETWIGKWREYSDFPAWKAIVHDLAERAIFLFPFDRYVGISRSTSNRIRDVVRRARGRIATIYFDFDPSPWRDAPDDPTVRDGLVSRDAFLIVGYGRPGTSKGFGYLVDAFASIRARVPRARLVLVLSDSPQYASALKALKSRAPDGVAFVESLAFANLVSLVRSADCVVVPSLTEGFGYTTLEACAAGTRVVASDTTSIPEVAGGCSLLVPPRDSEAIARAVVRMALDAPESGPLKSFPLMQTLDELEAMYRALIRTDTP